MTGMEEVTATLWLMDNYSHQTFSLLEHVDDDNDDDYYNDNNDDDLARWVKKIVISTDKLI